MNEPSSRRTWLLAILLQAVTACSNLRRSHLRRFDLGLNPEMAIRAFRKGLPPSEPWRVASAADLLSVSIDVSGGGGSRSKVLNLLREARRTSAPIMVTFSQPNAPFPTLVGTETSSGIKLVPFGEVFGRENYVGIHPDGAYGQTLLPFPDVPLKGGLYAACRRFEIYVATDQPDWEKSASLYHELAHAILGLGHPAEILDIQREAGNNAKY